MRGTKTRAALLVAQGKLTEVEIARACQIGDRQLRRWKQDPEFRAEVARHHQERQRRLDAWRDRIMDVDIADRSKRILRLDDDQKALDQIRTERAADTNLKKLPGGKTGLVTITAVRKVKVKSTDDEGNEVTREQIFFVHQPDTALLAESRALSEQAAREMGERPDKHQLAGKDGGPIEIESRLDLSKLTDEELRTIVALGRKANSGSEADRGRRVGPRSPKSS